MKSRVRTSMFIHLPLDRYNKKFEQKMVKIHGFRSSSTEAQDFSVSLAHPDRGQF